MSSIMDPMQGGPGPGVPGPGPGPGPAGPLPPGPGGLPPGLAAAVAAGAGPGPGPGPKADGDWEQDLHNAIAALRELAGDASDHIEASVIDKCIAALTAMTAKRQAGHEAALGVTPAHKSMARVYGG